MVRIIIIIIITKLLNIIAITIPSSSMISIVMVDADELFGGLMISSLPPMVSKPSARPSFMIEMFIVILVWLPIIEIRSDICS